MYELSDNEEENIPSTRKVHDSIYGFISFPKEIWEFIDSPHFQRLRNVKQLGCLSWVFPGAVGTRFQHCLGTGHLAQKYITTLIQTHEKKPKINPTVTEAYKTPLKGCYKSKKEEAIFIVTLAGILHDIGHGPYSHLFDGYVVKKVRGKEWQHELAGLCLIDILYKFVIDERKKEGEQKKWLLSTKKRVKALIIGKIQKTDYKKKQLQGGKVDYQKKVEEVDNLGTFNEDFKDQLSIRPWEFQIISNRLTGIDVDKLDYFRRDAYYLGAKNIYINHELLMNETLILEDKIKNASSPERHRLCYPSKYSDGVYDVFYSRYKLFKTYYCNLKSNGVDLMLAEILDNAKEEMKLVEACEDLLDEKTDNEYDTRYNHLTDSILERIELCENETPNIRQAKDLIKKLKKRDIYDFICQHHKHYSFEKIRDYYRDRDSLKQIRDQIFQMNDKFILKVNDLGFGMKDRDQLGQCRFYDKTKKFIKIEEKNRKFFSMLRPDGIVELSIRLYVKDRSLSEEKRDDVVTLLYRKVMEMGFISGERGTKTNRKEIKEQQTALNREEMEDIRNEVPNQEDNF